LLRCRKPITVPSLACLDCSEAAATMPPAPTTFMTTAFGCPGMYLTKKRANWRATVSLGVPARRSRAG
jgi:hypothetical protein